MNKILTQAEKYAQEAKDRQDPQHYVPVKKRLNQLMLSDGIFVHGPRLMGISFMGSPLNIYIEMGKLKLIN